MGIAWASLAKIENADSIVGCLVEILVIIDSEGAVRGIFSNLGNLFHWTASLRDTYAT